MASSRKRSYFPTKVKNLSTLGDDFDTHLDALYMSTSRLLEQLSTDRNGYHQPTRTSFQHSSTPFYASLPKSDKFLIPSNCLVAT